MHSPKLTCIVAIAAIFTGMCGGSLHAQETPVISDDFKASTAKWAWHSEIKAGEFILKAPGAQKYLGGQTLLRSPLLIDADPNRATHIHLEIKGISDISGNPGDAEARIFLTPEPLKNPSFADPYNTPDALSILLSADGTKGKLRIRLFRKTNQTEPGYGVVLYSGVLDLSSLPLSLDWYLGRKAYLFKSTPATQSVDGSKSGALDLQAPWDGQLRFIMRTVNLVDGVQAQVRIGNFAVTLGPIPE